MRSLIVVFLCLCAPTQCLVVGSNSVISRQALAVFPAADSDNEMRGFAAFQGGFTLENLTTACIFDSVFPVSGNVTLNRGTLTLSQDMVFDEKTCIMNEGTIAGNSRTAEFLHTVSLALPGMQTIVSLNLKNEVNMGRTVYSVDWSYDDQYLAVGIASGTSSELFIYTFDGTTLSMATSTEIPQHAHSVMWHPSSYYICIGIDDDPDDDILLYHYSTGPQTLTKTDGGFLTGGGYVVDWHPSGNWVASSSTNASKELHVWPYAAGSFGSAILHNLSPDRTVQRNALSWDASGDYLAFGTSVNASGDELGICYFDEVTLTYTLGNNVGQLVSAVSWSPTGPYIAVGLSGSSERLRIYEHKVANGTLTEKTSARVGESLSVTSLDWNSDGTRLAVGRETGSGTEFRVYDFDSGAQTLTLAAELGASGKIEALRWSHDDSYVARGDANNMFGVYGFVTSGGEFIFDSLNLLFNSDVFFDQTTVRFKGSCAVDGRGHVLDLTSGSNIIIASGASLLLKDVTLKGVSGSRILLEDSVATLSLNNVEMLLDADFTFTQGHIDIIGDTKVTGTNVFTYKSAQVSIIASHARLLFGTGMTFKYDSPITSGNLFTLTDMTSILHLCETTLHSTTTGLRLTKGTLVVEGACPVLSDATVEIEGIFLGDGASAANNVHVKVLDESGLDLQSGYLVYKNV